MSRKSLRKKFNSAFDNVGTCFEEFISNMIWDLDEFMEPYCIKFVEASRNLAKVVFWTRLRAVLFALSIAVLTFVNSLNWSDFLPLTFIPDDLLVVFREVRILLYALVLATLVLTLTCGIVQDMPIFEGDEDE